MFSVAEQLGIHDLKDLATRKTEQILAKRIWWRDFGRAIRILYTSTPPREKLIRNFYVRILCEKGSDIFMRRDAEVEALMVDMEATGRFMVDVVRELTPK